MGHRNFAHLTRSTAAWRLVFQILLSSDLQENLLLAALRRQRVAMAAANITLMTSAATNQYRPRYAAFASE